MLRNAMLSFAGVTILLLAMPAYAESAGSNATAGKPAAVSDPSAVGSVSSDVAGLFPLPGYGWCAG